MKKPKKFTWSRSYTFVLLANAAYILIFYFIMSLFS
ncbi:hypothetical protein SAMN05660776_0271 [Salegentibacter holothuriorum]|uniref:Uncharacterized protein n=1 Tax=Salegentibacter holothuriorum TaxID=241145 RepID=A0A1T5A873_9FLAO|nr:hypothetical protein SAMN05660776_0271 [Salegentibacter holothuriorum]